MTSFEWMARQVPEGQFLCAIGYEAHSIEEWASIDENGDKQDVCWKCYAIDQRALLIREGKESARLRQDFVVQQDTASRLSTLLIQAGDEGVELERQRDAALAERDNFERGCAEVNAYNHKLLDDIQELRGVELKLRDECARVERLRVGGGVSGNAVWTVTIREMFNWPTLPEPLNGGIYAEKQRQHRQVVDRIEAQKRERSSE